MVQSVRHYPIKTMFAVSIAVTIIFLLTTSGRAISSSDIQTNNVSSSLPTLVQPITIESEVEIKARPLNTDPDLVAHWTLDVDSGQWLDISGNDNHLTEGNNGVSVTDGPVNSAANFDLSQKGYLEILDEDQQGLDVTGSLTLAGWMNTNNPWMRQSLISKYDGEPTDNRAYELYLSGRNQIGFVASKDGKITQAYELQARTDEYIVAGVWYHVAAVFNASTKTMAVYLNGELVDLISVNHNKIYNSSAPLVLGGDYAFGYADRYFDGALDDWRVYSRALSGSEINDLVDAGTPPDPITPPSFPTPLERTKVVCEPSGGSGGLSAGTSTVTTIEGLNVDILVGDGYDPSEPTYLGFFLHGDGGVYTRFFGKGKNDPLVKFVNDNNWVAISPQAPLGTDGQNIWWNEDNWAVGVNYVDKFTDLLDTMFDDYNLCRNIIFGSGGSGGPEFMTRLFVPQKGAEYPTHTVLGCGGGQGEGKSAIRDSVVALGQNSDAINRSTMAFVYGTEDYLYNSVLGGSGLYQYGGFHVIDNLMVDAGHCNEWTAAGLPSLSEQIVIHWQLILEDLGLIPPEANFTSETTVELGEAVNITNNSTGKFLEYSWNFGDGSASSEADPSQHYYLNPGTYVTTLTISNAVGTDTFSKTVMVSPHSSGTQPIIGLTISNDGPTTLGGVTQLSANILAGENVIYDWDLGDGTSFDNSGTSLNHTYSNVGDFVVTVEASSSANTVVATTTVTIQEITPIANFVSSAPSSLGSITTFENQSTGSNLSYTWNFGDGSATSSETNPTHTYPTTGTFTVRLTATNSAGANTYSDTISIVASTPVYLPLLVK